MWNNEETQRLADIYTKLCIDLGSLVGNLSALEIHLEALKQGILTTVSTGCDLGQCLEQLYLKYPASTETTYMSPAEVEALKITLPKGERRETYIDTRGFNGQGTKATPRQDNGQTATPGDDGAAS